MDVPGTGVLRSNEKEQDGERCCDVETLRSVEGAGHEAQCIVGRHIIPPVRNVRTGGSEVTGSVALGAGRE